MYDPICNTTCPTGQFISSSNINTCSLCDAGCIACFLTSANCTINACKTNYYYYADNSSCISTCPKNYYANTTAKTCIKCIDGCQLCYGGSLDACTQCQTTVANISFYKVIDVDTCTTNCPPGQYPYKLLLACQYCSTPCLTCNTSSIDCQSCTNVSGIPYFNNLNQCLLNCPNGYYG